MKCYHHNDADGKCAAAIVQRALKAELPCLMRSETSCEFIEMDYNKPIDLERIEAGEKIIIVDFSFKPEIMNQVLKITEAVTWIDHHQTAAPYEKEYTHSLKGLRDFTEPGLSGCQLAWKHFFPEEAEPIAVHLIGDYDTWQHKTGFDIEFKEGLTMRKHDPTQMLWTILLHGRVTTPGMQVGINPKSLVDEIIQDGKAAVQYRDMWCENFCHSYGFEAELDGHRCYAANVYTLGSQTFGDRIREYDFCVAFAYDGNQRNYVVSLYSDTGFDVSVVAKAHGGGGHTGAAGFTCDQLPFGKV